MQAPALDNDRFLSFTVVERPLGETLETVAAIVAKFQLSAPLLRSEQPLALDDIYVGEPPAGGAHPHKFVLYAPKSNRGCTVMIANLADGWSSLANVMAERLGAKQAQIRATTKNREYQQVYFGAWVDGAKREVMCMRDSHAWVFHTRGPELPFEDLTAYVTRSVSKRLTRQMALDYVRAMGWDAADPDFWQSHGQATCFEQVSRH